MHLIPFFRDPDHGDLLHYIFFKSEVNGLVRGLYGGSFTNADEQVIFGDHHHITALESNFFVIGFAGQ